MRCNPPGQAGRVVTVTVTVAVIDSGVSPIPQLGRSTSAQSRSFVPGESLDRDDVHGTEMAVIVHAAAPTARLLILKALDDQEGGSQQNLATAIDYAVAHGARVINLSAAGAEKSSEVSAAIANASRHDVLVVVAAGNEGLNSDVYPSYPANYRWPTLVAVAAADRQGNLAANSNWGKRTIALGAAGVAVATFAPTGALVHVSGSSPAAAVVSGTAASVLSQRPNLTAPQLRSALIATAYRTAGLEGKTISGGELDMTRMLGCARTTAG
ncbi:MAG TPA: S8 family serine peptidase [Acidimicrobiales bacterium]|nr:S8 family serine peptidase [Acidimicrobiales bacterium]